MTPPPSGVAALLANLRQLWRDGRNAGELAALVLLSDVDSLLGHVAEQERDLATAREQATPHDEMECGGGQCHRGCGGTFASWDDVYRCMDCDDAFHKDCLRQHCGEHGDEKDRAVADAIARRVDLAEAWKALGTTEEEAADDPDTERLADSIRVSLQYERDQRDLALEQLATARAERDAARKAWEEAEASNANRLREILSMRAERDEAINRATKIAREVAQEYGGPSGGGNGYSAKVAADRIAALSSPAGGTCGLASLRESIGSTMTGQFCSSGEHWEWMTYGAKCIGPCPRSGK